MRPIERLGFGPVYKEEKLENGNIRVTVKPPSWVQCGSGAFLDLTEEQYTRFQAWRAGELMIQHALPELSAEQREILMTGIGPEKWKEVFPED